MWSDAERADLGERLRALIAAGGPLAPITAGHPYPGQRYRHGWIPVAGYDPRRIRQHSVPEGQGGGFKIVHRGPGGQRTDLGNVYRGKDGSWKATHVYRHQIKTTSHATRGEATSALVRGHGNHPTQAPPPGSQAWEDWAKQYVPNMPPPQPGMPEADAQVEYARRVSTQLAIAGKTAAEKAVGGHSDWGGHVDLFRGDNPDYAGMAAYMPWSAGSMGLLDSYAKGIAAVHDAPDAPVSADDRIRLGALLHEILHSVRPTASEQRGGVNIEEGRKDTLFNQRAYSRSRGDSAIEEGFNELSSIHHLPEFLNAIGLGDRPTPFLHPDYETRPGREHRTLAEDAAHLSDPVRIAAGTANGGVYAGQVKAAQDWTAGIARMEGHSVHTGRGGYTSGAGAKMRKRMVQLSDETTREGAAGKPVVMARQLLATNPNIDPYSRISKWVEDYEGQPLISWIESHIPQWWARSAEFDEQGSSLPQEMMKTIEGIVR